MTGNGILQIAIYFLVLLALTKPMGAFMAKVFAGERTWLHPVLRPLEAGIYKLCGVDETAEQAWTRYAGCMLIFSVVGILFTYAFLRMQQWFPLNPQGFGNLRPGSLVQYRHQFRHQHQLAGLLGRDHHELSQPDGGAGHSQFLVGGGGNRGGDRVRARLRAPLHQNARQLLGGFHTLHALRAAAALRSRRAAAVLAGSDSEFERVHQGHNARRHRADDSAGTGGIAGSHQDTRHQRRRLLQRQLGPPLRKSHAVLEFLRDDFHLRDSRRPHLHFRQDGEGYAPGLGPVRRHERAVAGRRAGSLCVGAGRQSEHHQSGRADRCHRYPTGRQHGGQGGALRHRQFRSVHGDHHRRQLRRGEQRARQPHAAGRTGAADQYRTRGSDLRRRGLGTLRHAAVRHSGGVHCRV